MTWRTNTETNHTTLTFSSGYEAHLLVQVVATHGSLLIGACFQLSSENTTARQLGKATPRPSRNGFSCLFLRIREAQVHV